MKIDKDKLDRISEKEVDAILEGLDDPELRSKPQFLTVVRKFMHENGQITEADTIAPVMHKTKTLPTFDDIEKGS